MRYVSLFSGIEAASVAFGPLGWTPVVFAEIDKFASAVLAHRYPNVPNLGDVTKVDWDAVGPVDLIVGGSPCQSFSVAGRRLGLDDPRGNLALVMLSIVGRIRPRWMVYENVPGLLSSDEGRDFGIFLGTLAKLGYGFAYRVLDAQHFGVPQRRRRVFLVGYLGDWRRAAAVLFERHCLQGHPPPRREAGQGVAGTVDASAGGSDENDAADGRLICPTLRAGGNRTGGDRPPGTDVDTADSLIVARCVTTGHGRRYDGESETSEDGTGRGTPLVPIDLRQASRGEKLTNNRATGSGGAPGHGIGKPGNPAFTISERGQAIAFDAGAHKGWAPQDVNASEDLGLTLNRRNIQAASVGTSVRRLTPLECERLQGFPDGWTDVPYRGRKAADGPRYKALGNSMAVPCMAWIGQRIEMVERYRWRESA